MYTLIPEPEIIDHRPGVGEPTPQVIDHREPPKQTAKWKANRRKDDVPYEVLKEQRNKLLASEFKYKRRIQELEKETKELVQTYEKTYEENRVLKTIVEHGADALKVRELTKQNKEEQSALEELQKQNNDLLRQLKNYQQSDIKLNDGVLEKNWKDALAKVKAQRDEENSIPTQGPFAGTKTMNRKRLAIDDNGEMEPDEYDLQLDNIEKETQILVNKIKQVKREKEHIDSANIMGKGAITKNVTIGHAIKEKLNRDLKKFAIRLEKLKHKHKAIKNINEIAKNEFQQENQDATLNSCENEKAEMLEKKLDKIIENTKQVKRHQPSVGLKNHYKGKQRSMQSLANDLPAEESSTISTSNNDPSKKSSESARKSKETHRELHKNIKVSNDIDNKPSALKSMVLTSSKQSTNPNQGLFPGLSKDDKSINYIVKKNDEKKQVHTKTTANLIEADITKTVRKQSFKTDDEVTGRYRHRPEPIPGRVKNDLYFKSTSTSPRITQLRVTNLSSRVPKISTKASMVDQSNRKLSKNNSYDIVLTDLNKQKKEIESEFKMQNNLKQSNDGRKKEHEIFLRETVSPRPSPIPIPFKSDGRSIYNRELRQIIGNSGLRFL